MKNLQLYLKWCAKRAKSPVAPLESALDTPGALILGAVCSGTLDLIDAFGGDWVSSACLLLWTCPWIDFPLSQEHPALLGIDWSTQQEHKCWLSAARQKLVDLNCIIKTHVGCFRLSIPYGWVVFQASRGRTRRGCSRSPWYCSSRLDIYPRELGTKGTAPENHTQCTSLVRPKQKSHGQGWRNPWWHPTHPQPGGSICPQLLWATQEPGSDAEPPRLIPQPPRDSFVFTTSCLWAFLRFLQGSSELLITEEGFHWSHPLE